MSEEIDSNKGESHTEKEEVDDLFGDSNDEGSDNNGSDNENDQSGEAGGEDGLDEGGAEIEEEIEEKVLEISIPQHAASHRSSGDVFTARIPAFLSVAPTPFDHAKYLEQLEEEKENQADFTSDEKFMRKLAGENTIRWRYTQDETGKVTKQSNAHFVRWSDGSLSLKIGTEIFDVISKPVHDTYLAQSHEMQEILQSSAHIDSTLSFVPVSMSSQTHLRLSKHLIDKSTKVSLVKSILTTKDPEQQKREAEKQEGYNLKARRKLEQKRRAQEERIERDEGFGRSSRGGKQFAENEIDMMYEKGRGRDRYEADDFIVDDDEEDEDEEELEEDEEDEELRAKRLRKAKTEDYTKYEDDEEEDDLDNLLDGATSGAAEDTSSNVESSSSRRKKRVIADDEDDE